MRTTGAAFLFCVFAVLLFWGNVRADEGCLVCHESEARMKELGYPQYVVRTTEVRAQTRMPASCTQCHKGYAQGSTKEQAHQGLLTVRAIGSNGEAFTRDRMDSRDLADWSSLEARGSNRSTQLMLKIKFDGEYKDNPKFKLVLYHDRSTQTLAFNPSVAEETCGVCHAGLVKSFLKSPMGGGAGAHTQSQYVTWTGPTGPQSCGLWLGKVSATDPDRFTNENVVRYNKQTTLPISERNAYAVQKRTCNQCHVGCLDCHYTPQKDSHEQAGIGHHTFQRQPSSLSCYGGGRSFACHAGPLERRRGDGYFREEFTQASSEGKKVLRQATDVHMKSGISCVQCHEPNRETGHHGDLRRDVDCSKCHANVVKAHAKGTHRRVDCASCHSSVIGGYAFNFWTVRSDVDGASPIIRLQGYLVNAIPPLIVRNPKGVWIPVHVVPHTSGNVVEKDISLSERLLFRNKPDTSVERRYFSNDSFAITGIARNVDDQDHGVMAWLNVDRISHGIGKARSCESCHASTTQRIPVKYESVGDSYKDVEDGEYTIIADGKGLRVTDFKGPDGAQIPKGLEPYKDLWSLRGNFLLPAISNGGRHERLRKDYQAGKFAHD